MHRDLFLKTVVRAFPLLAVSSSLILAVQPDLRPAIPLLAGVTAFMTVLLALVLYLGEQGEVSLTPAVILGVALLLRIFFLFNPPQLSDDVYRYLWDGATILSGNSPYAAAPACIPPPPLLKAVHSRINEVTRLRSKARRCSVLRPSFRP